MRKEAERLKAKERDETEVIYALQRKLKILEDREEERWLKERRDRTEKERKEMAERRARQERERRERLEVDLRKKIRIEELERERIREEIRLGRKRRRED